MRIALVQQRVCEDLKRNVSRATESVRECAGRGAALVCLQELFRTPYPATREDPERCEWAETIPGPTSEHMAALAGELGIVLIAPLFEKRAPGLYHNTALVFDADGSLAGHYRKMHLPDDPGFHEKFYFSPGDTGFHAFDTVVGRIGVAICWDQWFPEAARLLALDEASVIFYPSAIAWSDGESSPARRAQLDSWRTIQRGHAIANGIFVAAVNRVGREGELDFWGSSFVCDPQGQILEEAPSDEESLLIVDCPIDRIERQRREWPFLRDRRIDAYGDLTSRFRR